MADDCLFCRIARKEIPATIVAEDEHAVAFRDVNPQAPTHVLVIPRTHVASLDDVRVDRLGRVHRVEGTPTIATFHPRWLLQRPSDKALAWRDLLLLMSEGD